MDAHRHGQGGGTCPPTPENDVKCFFVLQMLSKLSRRSIYILFWENVVSFWALCPRPLPRFCP